MAPFQGIANALDAEFPRPRIDSEWLEQCCTWIVDEKKLSVTGNFQEFFQNVHEQLLKSDLRDSMQHGTGLPEVSRFTGKLSGSPVLVQIMAIKDMGVSAFQLEQIRAAREERMLAGVGDEEGEDGDFEVEGEGPMPKYPRGTLLLSLCDGATEFEAMEYRPLPQLVLGVTKLGYKLQLNGTRFSNGIAFLEPATVKLIGGEYAELHAQWEDDFKQYLQARLIGQAAETQGESRTTPLPNFPRALRAPLRDISPQPPTLHDDDIDMEPRRKRPSISLGEQNIGTSSNPRSIKRLPNRLRKSGDLSESDNKGVKQECSQGRPTSSHSKIVPVRNQPNRGTSVIPVEDFDPAFTPTRRESVPPDPEQHVQNPSGREGRGSFDFDLLTEVDDGENAPPRSSQNKGKGRAMDYHSPEKYHPPNGNSSDYGIDEENIFADDGFWEVLDRVEKEALEDGERSNTQSKSNVDCVGDGYSQTLSIALATPSLASAHDVIELDNDSDEEANKENAFVPMRHVRRRTEDPPRGRSLTTSQSMSSEKKKAIAINPSDVIDISDSD